MKKRFILVFVFFVLAFHMARPQLFAAINPQSYYVSSCEGGDRSGSSFDNASLYTDKNIWKKIQDSLQRSNVHVYLAKGLYSQHPLVLENIGNKEHQLLISGQSEKEVIFNAPVGTMIKFKGCKNIIVENLAFTGPIKGYGLVITSTDDGQSSKNIIVKNCHWYDLPKLYYGCFGAHNSSDNIVVRDCTFVRAGTDNHHHFIYNANNVTNMIVFDCHFQDSTGTYVRFRNGCENSQVLNCSFISTGKFTNYKPLYEVFIGIPNFNDVNPGDEQFGTNLIVANNSFVFTSNPSAHRVGVRFWNCGYDYPGTNYLMTKDEGSILEGNDIAKKKMLLLDNCKLDFDRIIIRDNKWKNENRKVQYSSIARFGAINKGWEGDADITDIVEMANSTPAK